MNFNFNQEQADYLESIFVKYGIPGPVQGTRDWQPMLVNLVKHLDELASKNH